MPDGVIDANFYRAASGVSDYVSPLEVIQLNPAISPASALREACFCWPDFITNPPNWRMVGVHVARCQSPNRALHRPTYMVLRRGVDAFLAMRPHGLIEILGLVPRTINEVFPTVLPERVNRPLILRLLGNLEAFCHRFIDCRVWVNGVEIDTHMIMIAHGFYILVQLQATVGADVVMAAEAARAVVRQGRFYHVAIAPSADVLYCPGGRTLASSRTMLVPNHPDLPGVDHLREARDQWPDLLGVESFMCTMLCAMKVPCLLPTGASYSSSTLHWTLEPMPLALLSILTPGVLMEEFTRNDLSRSPFCYSSLAFKECVPTQLSPVNASTMGSSSWITRSKSTMETMSRAGFSRVRSSLVTLFVTMSRQKKNLMENLSQTIQWLLHHDHLLPSGLRRDTGSVSRELEGKVVAIACLVSPSLGGRYSFIPSVPLLI